MLATAFLCTTASLAIFGGQSSPSVLAGGLLLGIAAMVIEAAAANGLDNLLLPLAVVGLTKLWTGTDSPHARAWCGLGVATGRRGAFAILAGDLDPAPTGGLAEAGQESPAGITRRPSGA